MSEPILHVNRRRAESFGEDAGQYDPARPSYPAELFDLLCEDAPSTALDVGCGTGIAARPLAARGCQVLGVEPDARMAAVARGPGIDVEVATFETWQPAARRFDLLVAAQAWHWVDPNLGPIKAADVLETGGRIGLFWNFGRPERDVDAALQACYRRFAAEVGERSVLRGGGAEAQRIEPAVRSLTDSGRFEEVRTLTFSHRVRYTSSEWLDLLATHGDHRLLAPELQAALYSAIGAEIDRLGGSLELDYDTLCVVATRSEVIRP